MNLRYIVRDGKKILQQRAQNHPVFPDFGWQDVPLVEEPPKSVTVTREWLSKVLEVARHPEFFYGNPDKCPLPKTYEQRVMEALGL